MESILVTGAAGAIGTALCQRLADDGHEVIGLDLTERRWETDVKVTLADLTESPELPHVDVIVHLAANSRVSPIVDDPTKAFENVAMTETILEHGRKTDTPVIFASSREVYGNAIRPQEDTVDLDSPNPYAASKSACESLCSSYYRCYDLPVAKLRLSNVYGRLDSNFRVIPIFISLALAGEELTVFGADKVLDFVHIDDVVDAFSAAIQYRNSIANEAINVGSGTGTPLTKLAQIISEEIDACPGYTVKSGFSGEVTRYVADTSKAESLLGTSPNISLEAGLKATIDWYRTRPDIRSEIRAAVSSE